ncbi:MAG: cupredoxin domain-containing protein [Dehalococcoidia bacterium]
MSCNRKAVAGAIILVAASACTSSSPVRPVPSATAGTSTTVTASVSPTVMPRAQTPAVPAPTSTVVARVGEPGLFTISAAGVAPQTVAVQAGRSASWLNADTETHRIVSDEPGLFDTGAVAPGQRVSVQVTAPGFHDWHDLAQPTLRGTLRIIP